MANNTDNIVKKGISSFNLVGKVKLSQYTYDMNKESDSGFMYHRLNLGIDCGNGNTVYCEMMGGYNPSKDSVIYVHGKDTNDRDDYKNMFTISWEDRADEDILKDVGENCFIKIGIEKDVNDKIVTEKFISPYDAIEYLNSNLEDSSVVNVRGNIEYSYYNGEVQMRKKITNIYLTNARPEEYKARFTQSFLLTSNSLSKKPNTDNNSLEVYGHVVDYVSKIDGNEVKKNVLFPKMFELDLNRYPDQKKLNLILKTYFNGKKNWFSELVVDGDLKEGATTVVSSIDDIPDDLKILIEMGLITEEEAIEKTSVTGTREKRMIFDKPFITKKIGADGNVEAPKVWYTIEKYKENEVTFIENISNSIVNDENVPEEIKEAIKNGDEIDLSAMFDGIL